MIEGKRAVDCGYSSGFYTVAIDQICSPKKITGIDINLNSILLARLYSKYKKSAAIFKCMNITKMENIDGEIAFLSGIPLFDTRYDTIRTKRMVDNFTEIGIKQIIVYCCHTEKSERERIRRTFPIKSIENHFNCSILSL